MLLREKAIRLVESLSAQYGWCFAHEATKREKMGRKYGQRPGEKSIGRVERQLKAEGFFERRRFYPGERLPPGLPMRTTEKGIVLVRKLRRQERRHNARVRAKIAAHRPPTMIGDELRPNRSKRRAAVAAAPAEPSTTRDTPRTVAPVDSWELEASRAMLEAIKKKPDEGT